MKLVKQLIDACQKVKSSGGNFQIQDPPSENKSVSLCEILRQMYRLPPTSIYLSINHTPLYFRKIQHWSFRSFWGVSFFFAKFNIFENRSNVNTRKQRCFILRRTYLYPFLLLALKLFGLTISLRIEKVLSPTVIGFSYIYSQNRPNRKRNKKVYIKKQSYNKKK